MSRVDVKSEVAGSVWEIAVAEGEAVAAGATLILIESMKMEIPVEAPVAGILTRLCVAQGDAVDEGQLIAVLDSP
ncbi:MAG: biotin/lipoyl-binding carrier protein [Pseudomonadales bacterium]|jgi:biotin carboxyl carrier protein|nr:biotin/lipoyl-binding carrier protein [Pseudomonadales bacterium]